MGDTIPAGARLRSRWPLFILAALAFLAAFAVAQNVRAEDAQDVRGTRHGCVDVTATGGWDTLTSASLESSQGSAVLASGLYWTEVFILNGSADVYVCLAAGASCGAGTGNKMKIASGSSGSFPLRGLSATSIAVYAAAATTVQVCGYFRAGG